MKPLLPLLCLSLTAALVACTESGRTFASGVNLDKSIDTLSDAEGEQFCQARALSFWRVYSTAKGCEIAWIGHPDPFGCEVFAELCADNLPQMQDLEDSLAECGVSEADLRAGCTETVDTLEGCMNALRRLLLEAMHAVDCRYAGSPEGLQARLADLPDGPGAMPECAPLVENCPALFMSRPPLSTHPFPLDALSVYWD